MSKVVDFEDSEIIENIKIFDEENDVFYFYPLVIKKNIENFSIDKDKSLTYSHPFYELEKIIRIPDTDIYYFYFIYSKKYEEYEEYFSNIKGDIILEFGGSEQPNEESEDEYKDVIFDENHGG